MESGRILLEEEGEGGVEARATVETVRDDGEAGGGRDRTGLRLTKGVVDQRKREQDFPFLRFCLFR